MSKLFFLLLLAPSTLAFSLFNYEWKSDLLPSHISPRNYNISLEPKFSDYCFEGIVTIVLDVREPSRNVTLHSHSLNVSSDVILLQNDSNRIPVKQVSTEDQFLIILLENVIFGEYTLTIKYTGDLNEMPHGFFMDYYYFNHTLTPYAATHFEPAGARRVFPCFDEPAYKATFDISVIHEEEFTAVSNMPVKAVLPYSALQLDEEIMVKTVFERTPIMSTYLIAVLVSKFDHVSNDAKNMSVWARPGVIHQANYALDVQQKAWLLLNEYIGISSGIKKLDQVALPEFIDGDIENLPDLVFILEKFILLNNTESVSSSKEEIAKVIVHELAHQWFGNLVTMKWWTYLWLNEGFASYFQTYITDKIEPTWRIVEKFVANDVQRQAFDVDENKKSTFHALNAEVEHNMGNKIIRSRYWKGAAIIRMMEHFLTDNVLQKGLRYYLKKHAYKSVDSDDLFDDLNEVVGKSDVRLPADLKTIMKEWVDVAGYPVVTARRNYQTGSVEISQKSFALKRPYHDGYAFSKIDKWWVPVNYASQSDADFNNTAPMLWLDPSVDKLQIHPGLKPDEWLILNKQLTGYYRVNYDEKNWQILASYLRNPENREKIHVLNRAQLIDDAFALVRRDMLDPRILLDLTRYLTHESDYIVWFNTFKILSFFENIFKNTEYYGLLKAHFKNLLKNLEVNFNESEDQSAVEKEFRVEAATWACKVGVESCKNKSDSIFYPWFNDKSSKVMVPPAIVLCTSMRDANLEEWSRLIEKALSIDNLEERSRITQTLACGSDKKILRNMIDNYPISNKHNVMLTILDNKDVGVDVMLDYLMQWMRYRILMNVYFLDIEGKIRTLSQLNKYETLSNYDHVYLDFPWDDGEEINDEMKWLKKHGENVVNWLQRHTISQA